MAFAQDIINWYHQHKRELPWRSTTNPYVIWLSEIILQQTRVEQGLPYFNRFLAKYPTIKDFAQANEDELLRLWQGLGYYSRARNMHKAARMIVEKHQGIFPTAYDTLIQLKGIGAYTAAAIASFSANEAKAVVDGNVFRVLARYFGIAEPINSPSGKKLFGQLADELLDQQDPATYNQAIMEFGALQCKPKSPDCGRCPIHLGCYARKENKVDFLPVKMKAKVSKARYFYYFIIRDRERIAMQKRGSKDIWANMYEFPMLEMPEAVSLDALTESPSFKELFEKDIELRLVSKPKKHILSHQHIYATFIEVSMKSCNKKNTWNYVLLKDLDTLAKPKLIFTFLREYHICNN
ncbi:A/G-specific adenine glycosylase [Olivibacter ginsenosidimutans]|uniref:Adenine DNA glycosylase n=1 Tax=Olivibacter ginsenosidimutans TaxID=1176537 RepID=A0ABP9C324_9SPHI